MPNNHLIHDLRNLLTVIAGCADAVRARALPDDQTATDVEVLSRAVNSAFELADELLAGPVSGEVQRFVDLNRFVAERVVMLRRILGPAVKLKMSLSAPASLVLAKPIELERILLNLVLNAVEAMPHGGLLTIETLELHGDEIGQKPRTQRYVRLTVGDTGPGISSARQQWLVHPASRTNSKDWALGVASVTLIVAQLAGRYYLESDEGTGMRFHVDLPLAPNDT